MDMGIVNAGQLMIYDDLDPELRKSWKMRYQIVTLMPPKNCSILQKNIAIKATMSAVGSVAEWRMAGGRTLKTRSRKKVLLRTSSKTPKRQSKMPTPLEVH